MSTITVYAFETHGDESATEWTTQDFREADEYAKANGYSLIAREYEYSDSELIDDYRPGHDKMGFPVDGHICGVEDEDEDPEVGHCDTCGKPYNVAERSIRKADDPRDTSVRCGDCGNCSEHCPPEHPRTILGEDGSLTIEDDATRFGVTVEDIIPGTPEWDESERALEDQRRRGG